MDEVESKFDALYRTAMGGSVDAFVRFMAQLELTKGPLYEKRLDELLDILLHLLKLYSTSSRCLHDNMNLMRAAISCILKCTDGSLASLPSSRGFVFVWPAAWTFIRDSISPVYLKNSEHPLKLRQLAFEAVLSLVRLLFEDRRIMLKMISTAGLASLIVKMWRIEVEDGDYKPRKMNKSCASHVLDRFLTWSVCQGDKVLQLFIAGMESDPVLIANASLKHISQPILDNVIVNFHIITVLTSFNPPLRHAFLAQHSVTAVTKILVNLTIVPPPSRTEMTELQGTAIKFALFNIFTMLHQTDGSTWVIQAIDAKLLFALVRCEPWLPYLQNEEDDCFYPFLEELLPNYAAYRSVLCVMMKSLASIRHSKLDAQRSSDAKMWKAWNAFVLHVDTHVELLSSSPGGLIQNREQCHSAKCARDRVRGEFKKCARCLYAQYCSKACQTVDWKEGGHKKFCEELQIRRLQGLQPELPQGDFEFVASLIEAERKRLQDSLPQLFRELNGRLFILDMNFYTCPTKKTISPPQVMEFCKEHDNALCEWWEGLRNNVEHLTYPTLVIVARLKRGSCMMPFFRVISAIPSGVDIEDSPIRVGQCSGKH